MNNQTNGACYAAGTNGLCYGKSRVVKFEQLRVAIDIFRTLPLGPQLFFVLILPPRRPSTCVHSSKKDYPHTDRMGDSDDEADQRRSRDKFRRSDGDGNDDRSSARRSDGGWQRGGPYPRQNYGGSANRRTQFSPPDRSRDVGGGAGMKRRRDWEDERDEFSGDKRVSGGRGGNETVNEGPNGPTQPAMMTFKQFLGTLDDSVDDEDSVQRYRDYKTEFKRQQIHEFFIAHKDEEWFRQKYHPEESTVRNQEKQRYIQERLDAYMELLRLGKVDEIHLEIDQQNDIIRFLDMALILMEGGTEADFKTLDDSTPGTAGDAATGDETGEEGKAEQEEKPENGMEVSDDSDAKDAKDSVHAAAGTAGKRKVFHKTTSIFLRNLPPKITKSEVEAVCKQFPGFLKVAIADPLPERRFFRRGWATFEPEVNTKEICWNLSDIRLRETELGAIVNRDLTRRIRHVTGIASHKPVVRSCIKLAARLVKNLDAQVGFWMDESERGTETVFTKSRNPILKGITDYLVEVGSAEEDEMAEENEEKNGKEMADDEDKPTIERDAELEKVLDRLLIYLRIVHSLDFYNCSDYPLEDEMPNRCGIIHVRGPPPPHPVSSEDVTVYVKSMETKLAQWLTPKQKFTKEEMAELGQKDAEKEVERFIEANTKKLSEDKWLCPLSGKKFKGADFVHKHILNKHAEKVEEVKKDVEYFNAYLLDPKRPGLPEHPATSRQGGPGTAGGPGGAQGANPGGVGLLGGPPNPFGFGPGHPLAGRLGFHPGEMRMPFPLPGPFPPFMGMHPGMPHMGMHAGDFFGRGGGGGMRRGGGFGGPRRDGRDMVSYRDLDAPGGDDDFP
ncbi:Serrate RNA effector molecule-like protein [Hypsibius exemplaris]|uniref:Serrate RNA effector molecule homolog n=1 Tax=Hypsibius exemplaris TaxID=2072580 RepID=A0A1W0WV48_HYPEX|nr:Serrate RNA effector molecule-like protein [Hypsibius exemplaris]